MRRQPLAAPVLALALGCTSTRNIPLDDSDRANLAEAPALRYAVREYPGSSASLRAACSRGKRPS